MSTTSMATTSADIDPTLGDDTDIGNQICIMVTTLGDGTLLCPRSFKEEDVVEFCVWLGQEHPEGVLWLLDTETVLVFQCDSDKKATMHCLTVATVWWGQLVMLCILPPKGRQVRDYAAAPMSVATFLMTTWCTGMTIAPSSLGQGNR